MIVLWNVVESSRLTFECIKISTWSPAMNLYVPAQFLFPDVTIVLPQRSVAFLTSLSLLALYFHYPLLCQFYPNAGQRTTVRAAPFQKTTPRKVEVRALDRSSGPSHRRQRLREIPENRVLGVIRIITRGLLAKKSPTSLSALVAANGSKRDLCKSIGIVALHSHPYHPMDRCSRNTASNRGGHRGLTDYLVLGKSHY